MKSVFMLAVPYEGLLEPAFTTRKEAEKHWADFLNFGNGIVEVKVMVSAKEESQ